MILTKKQYTKFMEIQAQTKALFDDIAKNSPERSTTIEEVAAVACNIHNVKFADITTARRDNDLDIVRGYIYYFCRNELQMTFASIGKYFNRDHSTILYAVKKFKNELLEKPEKEIIYNEFKFELL